MLNSCARQNYLHVVDVMTNCITTPIYIILWKDITNEASVHHIIYIYEENQFHIHVHMNLYIFMDGYSELFPLFTMLTTLYDIFSVHSDGIENFSGKKGKKRKKKKEKRKRRKKKEKQGKKKKTEKSGKQWHHRPPQYRKNQKLFCFDTFRAPIFLDFLFAFHSKLK